MKKFVLELDQKLKHLIVEELFYKKNRAKIGLNTDGDLPLNKPLKFPTMAIEYPQIFLDECLYE